MAESETTFHVHTHINGGWAVRREGKLRAAATFRTRREALAYVHGLNGWTEIVVHRADGRVLWVEVQPTVRHNTDEGALDCWCDPTYYKPCDECDSGCWKCIKGRIQLTREQAEDEDGGIVIVHNE